MRAEAAHKLVTLSTCEIAARYLLAALQLRCLSSSSASLLLLPAPPYLPSALTHATGCRAESLQHDKKCLHGCKTLRCLVSLKRLRRLFHLSRTLSPSLPLSIFLFSLPLPLSVALKKKTVLKRQLANRQCRRNAITRKCIPFKHLKLSLMT